MLNNFVSEGKILLQEEKSSDNFYHLTPGPALALSEELLQNLMKYGCASIDAQLEVKEERDTQKNSDDISDGDEDNVEECEECKEDNKTIGKAPLKVAVPRIKELVKMAKSLKEQEETKEQRQSKRHIKLRRSGRRKGRKPRSIKQGHVGAYKEVESKSETIEEKRAKWREVYYKKKALGTLKYQKFLSPNLPPDRKCSECGIVLRTYRSLVQHKNVAHDIPFSVS